MDVSMLTSSFLQLVIDNGVSRMTGDAARLRVTNRFLLEKITVALINLYVELSLSPR